MGRASPSSCSTGGSWIFLGAPSLVKEVVVDHTYAYTVQKIQNEVKEVKLSENTELCERKK